MPVCVHCGNPTTTLITTYSAGNIVLTPCDHCRLFADKYVEHDFVIIFIDLLLHRPQVYRHLLFNRLEYREHGLHPNIAKLALLLVLFEVYIKWFKSEKYFGKDVFPYPGWTLWSQYLYFLFLCTLEFVATHFGIRKLVESTYGPRYAIIKYNYISAALIISSFGKLLLILMVIWDYNELEYSWLVNILVATSQVEAISGVFFNIFIVSGFAKFGGSDWLVPIL